MLHKKVEDICNQQIEKEGFSSFLYLAMASWSETQGYPGIAKWLYAQAEEELEHMLKFVGFINERGGKAVIPALKKPPVDFKDVAVMFKEVLKHEQYITASINEIVAVCHELPDYTTLNWIQRFVNEQIEEERNAQDIIDKLNLLDGKNLYVFDRDIFSFRKEE